MARVSCHIVDDTLFADPGEHLPDDTNIYHGEADLIYFVDKSYAVRKLIGSVTPDTAKKTPN